MHKHQQIVGALIDLFGWYLILVSAKYFPFLHLNFV